MVIMLHLAAVVLTELQEGGSIISAMLDGNKLLSRSPEDRPRRVRKALGEVDEPSAQGEPSRRANWMAEGRRSWSQ
jgi:hypothetical protein